MYIIPISKVEKELADKGLIIEAGWAGLKLIAVPANASQAQLDEMRTVFFSGALHLFSTLMRVLEGLEPTDADLEHMSKIDAELKTFLEAFKRKHKLTGN